MFRRRLGRATVSVGTTSAVLLILLAPITQWITGYHVRKSQQAAEDAHRSTGAILDNAGAVEAMGMRGDVVRQWSTMNDAALAAHQAAGVRSVQQSPTWSAPLDVAARGIDRMACTACHAWNGAGGHAGTVRAPDPGDAPEPFCVHQAPA